MDSRETQIIDAMEQAAIAGLCREGQIEIGAQAARALYPELDGSQRFALAESLYDRLLSGD
jgi:hypothetical protein